MEQTTSASEVFDSTLRNCSLSNLSRQTGVSVAELMEQTTTQPQAIVASPSDSPELTSREASHFPLRPNISDDELIAQAIPIITTPHKADTMILKLMQTYSFNLRHLIDLLRGIVDRPMLFFSSIVA